VSDSNDWPETQSFRRKLLRWYRRHGRRDLPWKRVPTPYSVWVSEIMLQQTQVATVIPYFERFLQRFPGVNSLASASLDEVLHHWSGLGYYARARHLHRTARFIVQRWDGVFPKRIEEWVALPGVGRSTAGAILALAFDQRHPILDGNVKRVLTRFCAIAGDPGRTSVRHRLWAIADQLTPERDPACYTQAIMDLGATICTRAHPQCPRCPLSNDCKAYTLGRPEDFPGRREKKSLLVRRALFAILENPAGEVLLQRRPPAGVWGGLWAFPECPAAEVFSPWCAREFGLEVLDQKKGEILHHSFSHFRLDIVPLFARVRVAGRGVMEAKDTLWYNMTSPPAVGLAAPVRSLLSRCCFKVNAQEVDMPRMVNCVKLEKEAQGLARPPYPGELGKRIFEQVSMEAWQMWLKHQTMLINDMRLTPIDPRAREFLESEMEKFFFGQGSALPEGYVPPGQPLR